MTTATIAQAAKPKARKAPCLCKSYPFPHRMFSGKCYASDGGPYCGDCGKSCSVTVSDEGYGSYEFWGRTGVHRQMVASSDCCEADVFKDASLTIDY